MSKLLSANFARLWKSKLFYLCCAVMLLTGIEFPVNLYINSRRINSMIPLDTAFFGYVPIMPILLSVFVPLFAGTEYSDGTMRNKLVLGHKRAYIYLANLIVCIIAGFAMCLSYIISYLCIGFPLLGGFTDDMMPMPAVLFCGATLALMIAFTSLFTLIAMLWQNKAHSTAACILLVFLLFFAGIYVDSALRVPEYSKGYSITEDATYSEEKIPNPNYISGAKREFYEFLRDFLPGGQVMQLTSMNESTNLEALALYDFVILMVTTGCGVVVFKRKDLK